MSRKAKPRKAYLILEFANDEQKSNFVGGLLDGWGEGAPITVDWDSGAEGRDEVDAGAAPLLRVRVLEDDNA